jgi:hypothetical protein
MASARKCTLAVLILMASAATLHGQSLALGVLTLDNNGGPVGCLPGFYNQMTCYAATVSECTDYTGSTILPLGLTFGVTPLPAAAKGLVVLHAGGGGVEPLSQPGNDFASDIYGAGFQVVQIGWNVPWEFLGAGDFDGHYDLKGAACRPATFFHYIYQTYYLKIAGGSGKPGYCLLGSSAGAGAVGM